jgi:mRNA interferase HigB
VNAISRKRLIAFSRLHPDARAPLAAWFAELRKAGWSDTAELRRRFPAAGFVGKDRVVFHIHGNRYRLIIRYRPPVIFIRFVGTHAESDRIDATTI